jgi:hypothetical protein
VAFDTAGNQYHVGVDNALVQRVGKDCVVIGIGITVIVGNPPT